MYPVWTRITIHNVTRLVKWYTFDLIVCDILFTNAYMHFKGWYIKKCHVICERVLSFLFNFFIFLSSTVLKPYAPTSILFHSLKQKVPLSKTLLHLYYIVQNKTPINQPQSIPSPSLHKKPRLCQNRPLLFENHWRVS